METYGKQNIMKSFYLDIKYAFKYSKHTVNLFKSCPADIYTRKPKTARVGLVLAFVGILGSPLVPGGIVPVGLAQKPIKRWMLK